MPFCHHCGSSIGTDVKFCPKCRHPLHSRQVDKADRTNRSGKLGNRSQISLIIGIAITIFVFIPALGYVVTCQFPEDDREIGEHSELRNVQLAVTSMQAAPNPPILNFETDKRIIRFRNLVPINDMSNGGLITIADDYICDNREYCSDDKICPASTYLMTLKTEYYYTIDADGTVHGFYDRAGTEPIE